MIERCRRCGRDKFVAGYGVGPSVTECDADRGADWSCVAMAHSYRRGLADMLAIAQEHARFLPCEKHEGPLPDSSDWGAMLDRANCLRCHEEIDWTDVDAELAKRMEGR